jgi:polyhydroxybutyrate depolymerase
MVAALGVYACGGESGSTSGGVTVPEGGAILDDGAVVNADGDVVEQPDATPPKPSKVNATTENVDVAGNVRKYVLAVPKTYDAARKYPLIVAMHGDGQDAAGFRAFVPFDDIAGDDAIVAYTDHAEDLFTPYEQNGDQQLIEATINAVKAKYSIDEGKVWGFGYSKGGFMANEIGCRKPGLFKAMAIHAGGAPQEPQMNGFPVCPGVIGLPVLATEGEFDTAIGGDYGAQYWASINGCSNQRSATTPAPCQKHDNCPGGKPVVYCLAPNVSHFPIWERAAEVSWGFFTGL